MVYEKWLNAGSRTWYLEDSGESTKEAAPTRLLGSTQSDDHCQVSPDGSKIAFQSARSGFLEICTSNSDGSGFLQLTDYDGPTCGSPGWSPDSRWIAYDARREGQSEIYVISPKEGSLGLYSLANGTSSDLYLLENFR